MKKILASLAAIALGLGLVAAAAGPAAATNSTNSNDASYWQVSGDTCVKKDGVNKLSLTYAELQAYFDLTGKTVTKVIVKQGSDAYQNTGYYTDATYKKNDATNTQWVQVGNLTTTTFIHHGEGNVADNQDISHVIVCYITTVVQPTPVSGNATVESQTCDDNELVAGSITPTAMTGVVYQLWNAAKTVLLIDNFAANSGPLANGTYFVKVLPASAAYTVSEANTWLERVVSAYDGDCAPADVSGGATVVGETCDTSDYTLVAGSITPTATTGVVYQLWNSDKTVLLIDNFAANSGDLANGTYFVKVLPSSGDYTVSEANTWLERVVGAYDGTCIGEIKTLGDPTEFQECVPNENEQLPGSWVATLTIVAADHVQYRVYFHNGITWVEQGIWAAGVYEAGPTGDFPYGTKIKVVAEAVGNYILTADPNEWEFEFTQPFRCDQPTLGTVTPVVTFAQTCSAGATYTLGVDGGVAGTVLFSVNGGPTTTTLGTFAVASPSSIEIVATPGPDTGFVNEPDGVPDGVVTFTKEFPALTACGDLTTLALTGSSDTSPMLALMGFLGLLGLAMVRSGIRINRRQEV